MSTAHDRLAIVPHEACDYLMVLRGLSAIAVVFCHLPFELHKLFASNKLLSDSVGDNLDWVFNPFGYLPVLVFFSLSGYLITWGFFSGRYTLSSAQELRRYYLNRALRILPLYYFSILLCLLVYWDLASTSPGRVAQLFIMLENYKPENGIIFNHVYWTMPVEALYFLIAPFVYLLLKKASGLMGGIGLFCAASTLFFVIAFYYFRHLPISDGHFILDRKQWSLMARFDFLYNLMAFVLGGVCVFIVKNHNHLMALSNRRKTLKAAVLGWFLIVAGYSSTEGLDALNNGAVSFFIAFGLIPCTALLVLLVAVINETRRRRAGIFSKCFMHLGTLSYGVYLFHIPLFDVVGKWFSDWRIQLSGEAITVVVLFATLLFSQIAYAGIERPFLRRRKLPPVAVDSRDVAPVNAV